MSRPLQKILSVEDEEDIQAIIRLALESLGGFAVELCGSGSEALDRAAAFAPDLIMLDVMMPDMDGPTTLKALREIDQIADTPVVFLTAKVQAYEIAQFKALGAIDVIQKPFDPMTLPETVASLWRAHIAATVPASSDAD